MASHVILPLGTEPAPADALVPNAGDWPLQAVFAHFDGTAAASAWIPVLQILSNSGATVAEIPMDASVAAGASVEATWAPFLRGAASAAGGLTTSAPSVATFYLTDLLDVPISVPAGGTKNIAWPHAALPSDGSITGPFTGNVFAQFNEPCVCLETLYTAWDTGTYEHAGVIGANARITNSDVLGFANAGTDDFDGITVDYSWTMAVQPNAHIANDLLHAYLTNGDAVPHNVHNAYLVVYAWKAPGYLGAKPGYPL